MAARDEQLVVVDYDSLSADAEIVVGEPGYVAGSKPSANLGEFINELRQYGTFVLK